MYLTCALDATVYASNDTQHHVRHEKGRKDGICLFSRYKIIGHFLTQIDEMLASNPSPICDKAHAYNHVS